ncbi:aromatic ring-hydroxylating oxygenase subunit alpha [Bradyrhizobium sp. DOA9]|uniref:aromatic ring-hydroxylating oxygenase subunit alpha n=1 Tax=Bradyrhizobium sp. DOA9 TaxID=1126627 RepID=UPI000499951A|nr:aromatic ring-hydroxylating dioxygenase subunit alpha [Bradyrhizobium sp. DOA9]GAJ37976.1 benzoate 1,2-dioxygenase alpha subunit [Bradyrhizobium sp. DOA9]
MDTASSNSTVRLQAISRMVEDRPEENVFRVSRSIFVDPEVFDAELRYIFESTWNFIGLESQIARPNDFITTHIGRHPILLMRSAEGKIGAFLNTCRHRGTIVCPFKQGRQRFHVCRYHGWAFDSGGRNVSITEEANGQYPPFFALENHDLLPVARLESYRGFLFASLSPDVLSIGEYLGDARAFLDLVIDQSETGEVEFIPGGSTYTFDGNWKLQFENGLDYYHFASTHSSYADILRKRCEIAGPEAGFTTEPDGEQEGQGSFSFDHGHAVNWSIKRRQLYGRPLGIDADRLDALRRRVGDARAKWMLRQRNLTIFPNLQVIDISSAQVRTWRPLAPDRTELVSHCLAPVGESAAARTLRIRNYEEFFNASGLASSDDNVMYEFCQTGYEARSGGATQGYLRGAAAIGSTNSPHARELGINPREWSFGAPAFGGETNFYPGYREWRRLLQRAAQEVA